MYCPKNILQAQIDITNTCNLKCVHCRANANSIRENISINGFIEIVEKLISNGVRRLTISGWEPFLNKDIYLILNWLKNRIESFDYIWVTSNGFFYGPDFFEKIVEYKDFIHLQISVDGFEKEHDQNRWVVHAYAKTLANIKKLLELGIYVSTSTTVNTVNIGIMDELIWYLVSEGVKNISFRHEIPTGRSSIEVDYDFKRRYLQLLAKYFCGKPEEFDGVSFYSWDPIRLMVDSEFLRWEKIKDIVEWKLIWGCSVWIVSLYVWSNGIVQGCPYLRGDIWNVTEDISEIWKNEEIFWKYRDRTLLTWNCGACKWKHICGWCRAVAKAGGNELWWDSFCLFGVDENRVFDGYLKRYGLKESIDTIWENSFEWGIFVPLWAQALVNFEDRKADDIIESKWAKRDIKEIVRRGYAYSVSEKEEDLQYFYKNLYLDYALSKYSEDELILMPYFFHANIFQKNGKVLFVLDEFWERIWGYLVSEKEEWYYIATGFWMKASQEKNSFVASALYYFLIQWWLSQKIKKMSFWKTRLYKKDGVLNFKMKWGVERLEHEKKGLYVKCKDWVIPGDLFYL